MDLEKNNAPICLFVFNRLEHTKKTIEHLLKNEMAKETDIFVFSDGARNPAEQSKVSAVREYIKTVSGFNNLTLISREKNLGLANSIIQGVTDVVNRYGKVIVVEDDLITSPHFLKYMNDGLRTYAGSSQVASIHAYVYPIENLPETFFLKGADCWGWATWKDKWALFNPSGKELLEELMTRKLSAEFNFDNSYPYLKMLKEQISGKNNSWAIRWYASAFLKDLYTLYPGKSLVANIGNDDSGTHCGTTDEYNVQLSVTPVTVSQIAIKSDNDARKKFIIYFKKLNRGRVKRFIQRIFS